MHQEPVTQIALVQELREYFHAGQLEMRHQPIVNLVTNEVVGFEELMRWWCYESNHRGHPNLCILGWWRSLDRLVVVVGIKDYFAD
jgi:predicted signal transduction protein with EAL and GGDEF domain